jgi:ferredoxin
MAKWKILHFREECISCGACAAIHPDLWSMDDEGLAKLKGAEKVEDHWEKIIDTEEARARNQEVVEVCPVQIIKLEPVE